jgi:hypothetical protein
MCVPCPVAEGVTVSREEGVPPLVRVNTLPTFAAEY